MPAVTAVTLNGVFFGTCKREIGVILDVDESSIQLLNLNGDIKKISRFDVIYLAEYPVGTIPISEITNPEEKNAVIIKTLIDNEPKELARGWPIDFSEKSILFLTIEGQELIISRKNIFEVNEVTNSVGIKFKTSFKKENYQFHYPAMSGHCEVNKTYRKTNGINHIYPQQLIGNAILIKSSFDHFMKGHEQIKAYASDQIFYALPNLYTNNTRIGLWYNINSRHGASDGRNNNLIPYIISDYSDGPFGFQRRIITGTSPLAYNVHEEPQTLFSYEMKADYFHFSFMIDPSLILAGPNYDWNKKELDSADDRIFEFFHLALGIDYDNYAFEVALPTYRIGVRNGEYFVNGTSHLYRYGFSYQNQYLKTDVYLGQTRIHYQTDTNGDPEEYEEGMGADAGSQFAFLRYNLWLNFLKTFKPWYSLIYREYKYFRDPDIKNLADFKYKSTSITNYLNVNYEFQKDITISGYASVEMVSMEYESTKNGQGIENKIHLKTGASISLDF